MKGGDAPGVSRHRQGLGEGVQAGPHVCSSRRPLGSERGELAGLQPCASRRSCSTCSSWARRSSGAEGRCSLRAEQAGPRLPVLVSGVRGPLEVGLRSPTYNIPAWGSNHREGPDGKDLPSPGPVGVEPAPVPALRSRCFSLGVEGGQRGLSLLLLGRQGDPGWAS